MCGRYYCDDTFKKALEEQLGDLIFTPSGVSEGLKDFQPGDVLPSTYSPILTAAFGNTYVTSDSTTYTSSSDTAYASKCSPNQTAFLDFQRWGYPNPKGNGLIINARSESVMEKPMFRRGMERSRIVIPASGFYEWNRLKEKNTFYRPDHSLLFFAGICDFFEEEWRCVILTTAANASMAPIHDRMPLILERDQVSDWLWSQKAAEEILKQVPVMLEHESEYEQLSLF